MYNMAIEKGWDWLTLFLYIFISVFIALMFKYSIRVKNEGKTIKIFNKKISQKYLYYLVIYIILILFSAFRYVGDGIGGTDTTVYMNHFKNIQYVHLSLKELLLFSGYEYLFYNTMYFVRILGGNYLVFSFIVYSLIILFLIYVIDKVVTKDNQWIFIILFFLPFLKSFNIVRICLAASFGYIAIEKLRTNNYKLSILFSILAFLNHYMAIILFFFILFCRYFPKKVITNRKTSIILFFITCFLSFISLPLIKLFLSVSGFKGYLSKIEISLWGYLPIFFVTFLILCNYKKFISYLEKNNHLIYLKAWYFLIMILPIFICVNGASRIMLFFEIPRYILIADLYLFLREKYIDSKYYKVCDYILFVIIILWLVFRIWRIWDGYSLMPYYNILFF